MKPKMAGAEHLLQIRSLQTHFHTFEGVVRAVNDVSFSIETGEVLGVVGESGCGKSVTAQTVMRLIPEPPGKIVDGQILFDGTDLLQLPLEQMRGIRGKQIAMIFQEPMTSLNPLYTIGDQIAEMYRLHMRLERRESMDRAVEMLRKVQIPSPQKRAHEYPHQLSGGMSQRAMIAMALSCNPQLLIADEPTTALDVTIQAQILDLMLQLKTDYRTAIMMITHDLGVIAEMARRVVVMYTGKVVETAPTETIFENPQHPYTRGLLQSIPLLGDRSHGGRTRLQEIAGIVPSLFDLPVGCSFYPRCPDHMQVCRTQMPDMISTASDHSVRCWLHAS